MATQHDKQFKLDASIIKIIKISVYVDVLKILASDTAH